METLNLDEIEKIGSQSYAPRQNPGDIYQTIYKLSPEHQCIQHYDKYYGVRWGAFYRGWSMEHKKYIDGRRKDLKVDEFLKEYRELCKKYNAHSWGGGGDCDCGLQIEDYQFTLDIEI